MFLWFARCEFTILQHYLEGELAQYKMLLLPSIDKRLVFMNNSDTPTTKKHAGGAAQLILLVITALMLSGCGNIKRMWSGWTGDPVKYCFEGVEYLQFPSGATVKYDARTRQVSTCNHESEF